MKTNQLRQILVLLLLLLLGNRAFPQGAKQVNPPIKSVPLEENNSNAVSKQRRKAYLAKKAVQQRNGHITLIKRSADAPSKDMVQGNTATETTDYRGHVTLIKRTANMVYLGSGANLGNNASTSLAQQSLLPLEIGYYRSFWSKGNISIGANVFGEYGIKTGSSSNLKIPDVKVLPVVSATSNTLNYQYGNSGKQSIMQAGVGPQLNIGIGNNFMISPIFQVAYRSEKLQSVKAIQSTMYNGYNTDYTLYDMKSSTVSNIAMIPRLRLQYFFGNVGLWAEGLYNYSSKTDIETTKLKPESGPNANGEYQKPFLDVATYPTTKVSYNSSGVGVRGGMVIRFGGSKRESHVSPIVVFKPTRPKKNERVNNGKPNEAGNEGVHKPKPESGCAKIVSTVPTPEILYPKNKQKIGVGDGVLYLDIANKPLCNARYELSISNKGKEVQSERYGIGWNGRVALDKSITQSKNETYVLQLKTIPNNNCECNGELKDLAIVKQQSLPVFTNGGISRPLEITTSGCSTPLDTLFIDNAVCVGNSDSVRVLGHFVINPNGTQINSVTVLDVIDSATGQSVTYSNFSLPTTGGTFSFFTNAQCKTIAVRYTVNYTCQGETTPKACREYHKLPCCKCTFCDNKDLSNIDALQNSVAMDANGNMHISQPFSISPTNIVKATAEIIYAHDTVSNIICKTCSPADSSVYHLIGSNTLGWNGNSGINATSVNSTHSFPSKQIQWACNNQGGATFSLTIALPELAAMSCCSSQNTVCIRYTFTDKDCHTCEKVICYTVEKTKP